MNAAETIPMQDIYEPATEQPPYPVEASGWGRNSFYHYCENHGWRTNFAVCVTLLDHHANKKTSDLGTYSKCLSCISNGSCPAIKMRQEEIAAGQALYYQPRRVVKMPTSSSTFARRPGTSMSSMMSETTRRRIESLETRFDDADDKPIAKKAQKPKSPVTEQPIVMDMSKMVNDMMKKQELTVMQSSKPATPVTITRNPGESPLEFARRKAQMERNA